MTSILNITPTLSTLLALPALLIGTSIFILFALQKHKGASNYIFYLLCLEIIIAGINLGFVFVTVLNSDPHALIYATLILGIAAAEVSLGIAIIILIYDLRGTAAIL